MYYLCIMKARIFYFFLIINLFVLTILSNATVISKSSKKNVNRTTNVKNYSVAIQKFNASLNNFKFKGFKNFSTVNNVSNNKNYMIYQNGNTYYTVPYKYQYKSSKINNLQISISLHK